MLWRELEIVSRRGSKKMVSCGGLAETIRVADCGDPDEWAELRAMEKAAEGVAIETVRLREAEGRTERLSPDSSEPVAAQAGKEEPQAEILSLTQFRKQLQLEKRRADRTKSPLSLVLVRVEPEGAGKPKTVEELLDILGRKKRETDILGYVGDYRAGLILPHTDEPGVQAFVSSIARRTTHLPISVASGTYPDDLFDSLSSDPGDVTDTVALLLDEGAEPRRISAGVKRAVDIFGALAGILMLSPFMLVIALAVSATSSGPVVFRQMRLGRGGVPFVFYKFRSMRTDADDRIHREYVANLIDGNLSEINQGDESRPLYKMSADPRITPVGRFLRKTSLDELPQLFNVLKGDMSLVGPRPPLPYEVERYQSWHFRRVLQVRPGITGLWQVDGRSTTSFDEMVRLDLRYIRDRSLWLDLKILLKTVKVVLRRDGAG